MRVVALLLVTVFLIGAIAQKPNPPTWPVELYSDIELYFYHDHSRFNAIWEYSQKFNAEKTVYFHNTNNMRTTILRLYETQIQYIIVETPDNSTTCHQLTLTEQMVIPDFSSFAYGGSYRVHGYHVDVWKSGALSYMDDSRSTLPVRFENYTDGAMLDFFFPNPNGVYPTDFDVPSQCNSLGAPATDCMPCQQVNVKAYNTLGCSATQAQILAFCGQTLAATCTTTIQTKCANQCTTPAACAHAACCASGTCQCPTTGSGNANGGTHSGNNGSGNNGSGNNGSGNNGNGSNSSGNGGSSSSSGGSSGGPSGSSGGDSGGSSAGGSSGGSSGGGSSGGFRKININTLNKAKLNRPPY